MEALGSAAEDSLAILHVSDAHFGIPDTRNEMPRIVAKLIDAAHRQELVPDICVFSGDLAQSGERSEFDEGLEWLLDLTCKWPHIKLFIVPGNHDVQRTRANLVLRQAFADEQEYAGKREMLETCLTHLQPFFEFHAEAKAMHPDTMVSDWSDPFGCSYSFQHNGRGIRLLGLNTALFACANDDSGKLVSDIRKLNDLLDQRANDQECVIAVGHHPLTWLVGWNQGEVQRLLRQKSGAHLYLHGHQHEQVALTTNTSRGDGLVTLECGAAYQSAKWPNYFSVYRLDFAAAKVETSVYALAPSSGNWVKNNERSGSFVAELPEPIPRPKNSRAARRAAQSQQPSSLPELINEPARPEVNGGDPASGVQIDLEAFRRWENGSEIFRHVNPMFDEQFLKGLPIPIYRSESRLKQREGIYKKVLRRIEEGETDYTVGKVEDVCGFRFVSVFQSDIPQLMEHILKRILAIKSVAFENSLRITVHSNRPKSDPLSIRPLMARFVEEWSGNCDLKYPDTKETGYSSVHVVLDGRLVGPKTIAMPIEIQFRSGLEEFWGQLDHQLRYFNKRGAVGKSDWEQHLNVLKAQFDATIQYADLIKKVSQQKPAAPLKSAAGAAPESSLSISNPTVQLEGFRGLLPDEIFLLLESAYELWQKADASKQFGGNKILYEDAADAFIPLVDGCPSAVTDAKVSARLSRTARMERAYMLSESKSPEGLEMARSIYDTILDQNKSEPTALLRMGLLLIESKKFKEAIHYLNRAIDVTEAIAEPASGNEAARIFDYARTNKAIIHFRAFEDTDRTDEARIESLQLALTTARAVLQTGRDEKQRLNALNDFVYYLWEEREFLGQREKLVKPSVSDEEYRKHAERLLGETNELDDLDFRKRDTLCRVAVSLELWREAQQNAGIVVNLLEQAAQQRGAKITSQRLSLPWATEVVTLLRERDETDSFSFACSTLTDAPKE